MPCVTGLPLHRPAVARDRPAGRGETRIAAATIVLAAGAYGSPAILRLGVGDPAVLEAAGIPTVLELRGVGRNLHDHPLVELEFTAPTGFGRCSPNPPLRGSRPRSRRSAS